MLSSIREITFFVDDIDAAAGWYARLLDRPVEYENPRFAFVQAGTLTLGFHPADAKSPGGHASSVAYFNVPDLDLAIARLTEAGGRLYRGPGPAAQGARVAQVLDPFGNAIGLFQPGAAS